MTPRSEENEWRVYLVEIKACAWVSAAYFGIELKERALLNSSIKNEIMTQADFRGPSSIQQGSA